VDLAEDVMSEALVRTLPRLSKVRHPDAYLRRVAQTAAADMCAADGRELARRKGLGVSG
jgi:DNA-directed RNA polymerase specialized sigma24 family protein